MLILEIIRVAFGALLANKGRAFLTMLGIIIGVGAVIAMMAIGAGAQKAVQDRIASMGVNQLRVFADRTTIRGVTRYRSLTTNDAQALRNEMTLATAVVPDLGGQYQVKYGNKNNSVRITGTTPEYFSLRNYQLMAGRFFTNGDLSTSQRVAVLGSVAAENLGIGPESVGSTLRIGGMIFDVIGIMESKGSQGGWDNPDEAIYIPITTAQYRLMGHDRINGVTVQVVAQEWMLAAQGEMERILRRERQLRPEQQNDFRFFNQQELATTFAESTKIFGLLLASIAAVSLIVGGIGIMNIMLVSVTERTREIGIRKALGARRSIILLQFLLESITLCVLGGAVGMGLGYWVAKMMASSGGWEVIVTPQSLLLAVGFSVGVGLFFGIYPASRAAKLDPIEALRYE